MSQIEVARYNGLPYRYKHGPLEVATFEEARKSGGANCQAVTHFALKDLGYTIPPEMRSAEIYTDTSWFREVTSGAKLQQGDIFLFAKRGEQDPKTYHLAPFLAEEDGKQYFLDASYYNGGQIRVSTLEEVLRYTYDVVGLKRVR